ncbi:hypothetical protein Zm00014a_028146 [Zea mays]|uniref:Uncharacterized protein n=1 Tax=Zea mays TaxID=4577 RepID=A0A3L6EFB8_MAIZE|nr:hypothetical protein Zm00014a_028146 [Zea mays]
MRCTGRPVGLPEHDGGDEAENGNGADSGAAEIDEHLLPGLGLLPPPLAPDEVSVPPPGRLLLLLLPSLPRPHHGGRDQPHGAFAADRRAVGVLDGKADLPDVRRLQGAGDGGLELAPGEHERVAQQRVARVPVPVDGDGAAAGHVDRAAAAGVDRDPAELQLRRGGGGGGAADGHGGALALHGVDAEGRGEEPRGRRARLHDAGQQRLAAVVDVHGGDEAARDGELWLSLGTGHGGSCRCGAVVVGREREGVGEEALRRGEEEVRARGGQRRPPREAERAPRLRVGGERPEARGRAAGGGQGRAVEAAQRAGQHVGGEVLQGGGAPPRHVPDGLWRLSAAAALRFNGASSTAGRRVAPSQTGGATLQSKVLQSRPVTSGRWAAGTGWRYGSGSEVLRPLIEDGAGCASCRAMPLLSG